ncbi:MAG: glycoside hydrolase family 27 protein [Bacteroidales bacterium]|nr:glycoside hydrolase family 27 protein [Bacteroidales bacterium]
MKKISVLIAAMALAVLAACTPKTVEIQQFGDFRDWSPTPPMGWNSWDCYGPTVVESEVKANADYMAANLKKYGWEYVVVDIRWFVENDKAGGYNQTDPRYVIDEWGRYQPAVNRFPSAADGKGFKELADYVHGKGLKFGIHIMRGIPRIAVDAKMPVKGTDGITADQIYNTEHLCAWLRDNYTVDATKPGAQEYYNSIFDLYASWGVDYIKIDDLSAPFYHEDEIDMIRKAIDQCGRPIVLSTSPGATPVAAAQHVSTHANLWRMVNDVWDIWRDVTHLMRVAKDWYPYIGDGTWPDCDMIPLGHISIRGERGAERDTRLTKDEQYSLMTFFTIFRSPLMFGGDLPSNDEFTLSLLTNEEVLKMHREGAGVHEVSDENGILAVSSTNSRTGEVYLAVFNKNNEQAPFSFSLEDALALKGAHKVVTMWDGQKVGKVRELSGTLQPHACVLYKISK